MTGYTISGRLTLYDPDGKAITWEDYGALFDAKTRDEAKQLWADVDEALDQAITSLPISPAEEPKR